MINLTLKAADAKKLEKKITDAFGKRVEKVFEALHENVLAGTAMNSGRTLGSWAASRTTPAAVDIGPQETVVPGSNDLPVGAEPGREVFEEESRETRKGLNIAEKPFDVFLLSNAASLDSEKASGLDQGPGSRAFYQEFGVIAGFNPFGPDDFEPRTEGAVRLAVQHIKEQFKKL